MSCEDIPSLLDLQKAKLNADDFSRLVEGTESGYSTNGVTGETRKTLPKILGDAESDINELVEWGYDYVRNIGFDPAPFTFVTGGTITEADVTVFNPTPNGDNNWYSWNGPLPKTIPANSTPASTGGVSQTAWVPRTDQTLRQEITAFSGNLTPTPAWSDVPAHSDDDLGSSLNAQALALAARTEYLDNKIPNAVNSFAALRTTTPEWAGQRIVLAGWNAGSILGAGEFIAFAGDVADDGGLTARVNASWYWRRSNVTVLTPDMFGGYSDGSADSVAAVTACEAVINATGYSANYTGKWSLSRNVIVGSAHNRIVSSKTSYTGAGKLIVSGSEEGSYMRRKSSVSPINSAPGNTANQHAAAYHEFFINQTMNNQGLAYYNGYYYVGYDTGGGNGVVERYGAGGHFDSSYGGVNIPINHAAELAYRVADQSIYVASGGGSEPTYVRKLAADGKSVAQSIDFTAYGNSALCAIDNVNDILILHSTLTGGDGGLPTFTFFSFSDLTIPLKQFTLPATLGVPQGMDVFENTIYFYTNNKVTMVTYDGELRGSFTIGTPGESEGLTIVADYANAYIAVGYNTPSRVMTVRSPHGMISKGLSCLVNMNPQNNSNVSKIPCFAPFSIRKTNAASGAEWIVTTYVNGDHPGFANLWYPPTIDSANKRILMKLRADQISTIASVSASFNGNVYGLTGGPFTLMCDFSNDTLSIYFQNANDKRVDPATIAGTAMIWGQVIGGMSFNNAIYPK